MSADKLSMSLEDLIPPKGAKGKGGKGAGGKTDRGGRGGAREARNSTAPYQRPGKGKGKGKPTLASMAEAQAAQPAQPAFELTTGTTIRVGNLDWNVSAEDLEELVRALPCSCPAL